MQHITILKIKPNKPSGHNPHIMYVINPTTIVTNKYLAMLIKFKNAGFLNNCLNKTEFAQGREIVNANIVESTIPYISKNCTKIILLIKLTNIET